MNFLKKILAPGCLIISLCLLIYTFYRSEIYWNGEKSAFYLKYYIFSIIIFLFSIFAFFLNQNIKEYVIISLISITASLYIFELYLNFDYINYKKQKIYLKQTGKKFDNRSRFKLYEDLKKINNNIKVDVPPMLRLKEQSDIFPLSGFSNSKTIDCNENGYYSIYNSDRYGFNNPDKEWNQKEIEYLLVGDSYTHGACVNRPHDIASVLRALSNKSVINLGYGGNGPLIEYATLREYFNINTKKILWIYMEQNDIDDLEKELENKILIKYLNNLIFTQNLKQRQNEINNKANIYIEVESKKVRAIEIEREKFKFKLFKYIKLFNVRYSLRSKPQLTPPTKLQPEFKKILKLTKYLAKENNAKLYFVYLPAYIRYKKNYNNINYQSLKKIVNELDIPFIDIHTEVFEKEGNPLKLFPFESYGHYNVEGFRKVAKTIYKFTKH